MPETVCGWPVAMPRSVVLVVLVVVAAGDVDEDSQAIPSPAHSTRHNTNKTLVLFIMSTACNHRSASRRVAGWTTWTNVAVPSNFKRVPRVTRDIHSASCSSQSPALFFVSLPCCIPVSFCRNSLGHPAGDDDASPTVTCLGGGCHHYGCCRKQC